jgi:Ca2+-binding RTX toxin-like protein
MTMALINMRNLSAWNYGTGTSADDIINGSVGNDIVSAGAGNDTVDGGAGNDVLDGGTGSDVLYGGTGNDILSGGRLSNGDGDGALDRMYGGAGNDYYIVADANDQVFENAGEGTDTVIAWRRSYTLGANVENLEIVTYRGDVATGTGNELDNVLTGMLGNETLYGMDGNDTIGDVSSYNGNDYYVGGRGNDSYRFGWFNGRDVIDNRADDNATTTDKFVWTGSSNVDQLWFRKYNNDLCVTLNRGGAGGWMKTADGRFEPGESTVRILGWYSEPSGRIDCFVNELAGKRLMEADVQKLVDAMAVYDAKKAAGPVTAADYAVVNNLITACWKTGT